jgi:bacteriorhodopsin
LQRATDATEKEEPVFLLLSVVLLFLLFGYYAVWARDPKWVTRIESKINRKLLQLEKRDTGNSGE